MRKAEFLAEKNDCMDLKTQWALPDPFDVESPQGNAHILFSAANWIRFWAEKGHGYHADF